MKWINFKDELPEIGKQIIIVYNVGDGIEVNQGSRWPEDPNKLNGNYPWYYANATIFYAEHAFYWMPLPKPPEEK